MSKDKKALGKGLSALIADNIIEFHDHAKADSNSNMVINLAIDQISPNPYQPRKFFNESDLNDLCESIKHHGVLQPILIRKSHDEIGYELVAGERRWQASIRAGLETIPAVVLDLTNQQMLEYALLENIQRKDLNPIEEAEGYKKLSDEFNYTQEMLASKLGKSRSHIANTLRLLQLPYDIQERVMRGDMSVGHARTLVGKENASELADRIVNEKLNVRQAESLSRTKDPKTQSSSSKDSDLVEIEDMLSNSLGMKVTITDTHMGGSVAIDFTSLQQLDTIIQRLSNSGSLNF